MGKPTVQDGEQVKSLSIMLCFVSLVFATGIVWERTFPGSEFKCIRQTEDEGFVAGGRHIINSESNAAYVFRFNSSGEMLWSVMIGDSSFSEGRTDGVEGTS